MSFIVNKDKLKKIEDIKTSLLEGIGCSAEIKCNNDNFDVYAFDDTGAQITVSTTGTTDSYYYSHIKTKMGDACIFSDGRIAVSPNNKVEIFAGADNEDRLTIYEFNKGTVWNDDNPQDMDVSIINIRIFRNAIIIQQVYGKHKKRSYTIIWDKFAIDSNGYYEIDMSTEGYIDAIAAALRSYVWHDCNNRDQAIECLSSSLRLFANKVLENRQNVK